MSKKRKSITYRLSGVDTRKAEQFVAGIKSFVGTNAAGSVAAFGSLFNLKPFLAKMKRPMVVSSTDGVGTKLNIAQDLNVHDTVGVDLVAMNVNDIICLGAQPLFFLDYIACGKVNPKVLHQVVKGINRGLAESGCLLLGGETAEMPGMYKKDEYDLAGFCVGIVDQAKIINGSRMQSGDVVLGLASSGIHSNGFSLVRKALGKAGIKKHARTVLTPTRLYVKPILSLLARFAARPAAIKGIAHVTGGAFYSKITKIVPQGYGMVLDTTKWPVPEIFTTIQEKGSIAKKEMYSVFNMGIGMAVVVQKEYVSKALQCLRKYVPVFQIGEVVKSSQRMELL